MIEQMNTTTYGFRMPSGDIVEVGNKEAPEFRPHIKLNRWDGECFIKAALQTTEKHLPIVDGDKIRWVGEKADALFYPVAKSPQMDFGGFEFAIILKEKPASNKISLKIETQGLEFYYQPPLIQEEIDKGAMRPDNVVGSYAVYHATRTNVHRNKEDAEKYKCGKAFHIYRPKAHDANGNEIWCDLDIDTDAGLLIITVDQALLDSAVYPITIDPNFGYETAGLSYANAGNEIIGSWYEITENGTADSITFRMRNGTSYTTKWRCAIYDWVANNNAGALEGDTEEGSYVAYPVSYWKTLNMNTPKPSLSANTKYFLVSCYDIEGVRFYYDSGTAKGIQRTWTYQAYPDPLSGEIGQNRKYSIYCTYTPGAPPAGIPKQMMYYKRMRGL